MKLLVQKFGGTSVKTKESRQAVMKQIKHALAKGYKVVAVVSAIGRNPDPYATESLLSMVDYPVTKSSKRELDMLMSCGEVIASVVLSNELQQENIAATSLTGAQAGLITDEKYTEAKIKKVKADRLLTELEEFDVVVVAGFQGRTEEGDITTIGRGGSDTSAAAFGAALSADAVEIFTDVNGIMTADPNIVANAQSIDTLTYVEISNLAHQGAKVIHPRAIEIAMQADIPLYIKSTYSNEKGTLISASRGKLKGVDIADRLVTGIAHIDDISQVHVETVEPAEQKQIFNLMAENDISVDFINITKSTVTYTVPTMIIPQVHSILESHDFTVEITKNCAKVSAVGAGMTGIPGVIAKIVTALEAKGVRVLQAADSHTTIWVLINDQDIKAAVNALHEVFELNKPMLEIEE